MNDQQNDQPIFALAPLERVREGMTVLDADGRPLGTVTRLQMGDPQAATTAGNEPTASGVPGVVVAPASGATGESGAFGSFGGSDTEGLGDVPAVLRRNLRRAGFIQVDGPGLEGANRFVPGDRVAEVSGDSVRLHPVSTKAGVPAGVPDASLTSADLASRPDVDERPAQQVVFTTTHDNGTSIRSFGPPALVFAGATAVMLGGTGVAGWLYLRSRREQARPINRLRRTTARLRQSLADDYPVRSGVGGGAMLLVLLAVARRARRNTQRTERADSTAITRSPWATAQRMLGMLPTMDDPTCRRERVSSRPSGPGLGLAGGLIALSGAGVLIWRRGSRAVDRHGHTSHRGRWPDVMAFRAADCAGSPAKSPTRAATGGSRGSGRGHGPGG